MNLTPTVNNKKRASFPAIPTTSSATSEQYENTKLATATQSILTATFSLVGQDFLRSLAKEIARWTQTQTVMLQQLMTMNDLGGTGEMDTHFTLATNTNQYVSALAEHPPQSPVAPDSPVHDSNSSSSSSSSSSGGEGGESSTSSTSSSNHSAVVSNDRVLVIRASHTSAATGETIKENTAVPLASLHDTPHMKTLVEEVHYSVQHQSYVTAYPHCQSFVGLRLDAETEADTWLGILCVMDDKPMDVDKISFITKLLASVRQRATRELERMHDKERLIQARNAARLDAENKLKFLADMSHEIRTPMNAVIALTDLLLQERNSLNDEQKEHLEVIQTSGNHLLTIINDILDLSKLNHDPKFKLESRCFSLRKCVKDTLNMARHQASMSQHNKVIHVAELPAGMDENMPLIEMTSQLDKMGVLPRPQKQQRHHTLLPLIWDIDERVPDYLMGDTMRLTQIMLNLCSNAVKFTKQGGIRIRIKLYVPTPGQSTQHRKSRMSFRQRYDAKMETIWTETMRKEKESMNDTAGAGASDSNNNARNMNYAEKVILEISVTDTGIGIPADRLPKLFKSFSQIDISTARRYGGTGLGLAISSTLVNHMGGALWVESDEGAGSCFGLTLPMTVARPCDHKHRAAASYGPVGNGVASPPSPSSSASEGDGSMDSSSVEMSGAEGRSEDNDAVSPLHRSCQSSSATTGLTTSPAAEDTSYFSTTMSPQPTCCSSVHSPSRDAHPSTQHTPQTHSQPSPLQSPPFLPHQQHKQHSAQHQGHVSKTSRVSDDHAQSTTKDAATLQHTPPLHAPISPSENHKRSLSTQSTALEHGRDEKSNVFGKDSPRSSRSVSKPHYHARKSSIRKDDNTAQLYPMKIMLAEDNELNQKIAISILKRLGYGDVSIANNGREVLSLMQKDEFDVIFMDLYMPEMDGLEATRVIIDERNKNRRSDTGRARLMNASDVYIVALTASAAPQDRQICIDAGMNDFISKPFTMLEMKSSLHNCYSARKKRKRQQRQQRHSSGQSSDDPMTGVERGSRSSGSKTGSGSGSDSRSSRSDPMSITSASESTSNSFMSSTALAE